MDKFKMNTVMVLTVIAVMLLGTNVNTMLLVPICMIIYILAKYTGYNYDTNVVKQVLLGCVVSIVINAVLQLPYYRG